MIKRDHGPRNTMLAAVFAVTGLILIGYAILLLNPPTALDKKCLGKLLATMGECLEEYYRENPSR